MSYLRRYSVKKEKQSLARVELRLTHQEKQIFTEKAKNRGYKGLSDFLRELAMAA